MLDFILAFFSALATLTWLQWLYVIAVLFVSPLLIVVFLLALMAVGETVRWFFCLLWTFWGFVFRCCSWQDLKDAFFGWGFE